MEAIAIVLGLLAVAGAGLAIYEWRRGRPLIHEDGASGPPRQSEADREAIRSADRSIHGPPGG
jgi:hypothetical protein